jgi:hypothetical protein
MSGIRQKCRVLGVNKRQIYPTLGKKESNERTLFLTKRQKYGIRWLHGQVDWRADTLYPGAPIVQAEQVSPGATAKTPRQTWTLTGDNTNHIHHAITCRIKHHNGMFLSLMRSWLSVAS